MATVWRGMFEKPPQGPILWGCFKGSGPSSRCVDFVKYMGGGWWLHPLLEISIKPEALCAWMLIEKPQPPR